MKRRFLSVAGTLALSTTMLAGGANAFELTSPDILPGRRIPREFVFNGFGCTGQNVSPAMAWTNPPAGTKSFALMVHDPDAPTGGAGFWHWVVINLPGTAGGLAKGAGAPDGKALPPGAMHVATDFGSPGWGGPCPPAGDAAHRYQFTVYALKVEKLELPLDPTASLTGFMINQNAIAKATFTGLYGR